jgi:hypothetical protein
MGMVVTDKKYVLNIDFPTAKAEKGHKIHLNPYFEGSALKEKILRHYDPKENKIQKDGGASYLTKREALEYLKGNMQREWLGRVASTFRSCKLCNRLPEWDL